MTTTTMPGNVSCACICPPADAACRTTLQGGRVCFENDRYRITCGDDNTIEIRNKHTGERYRVWGDPHVEVDGRHAFDFWGRTTFVLDDGTKLTIQTVPWAGNPSMTLASTVTITSGDYAVQITGIDSNRVGDLRFEEARGWGAIADALVPDGNRLYENPFGAGFLGAQGGCMQRVDQAYIDRTDLARGGALAARWAEAFGAMAGLLAVAFIGRMVGAGPTGDSNDSTSPADFTRPSGALAWAAALAAGPGRL